MTTQHQQDTQRLDAAKVDQIPLSERPLIIKNLVASWAMEGLTLADWQLEVLNQWARGEVGYARVDEITDQHLAQLGKPAPGAG